MEGENPGQIPFPQAPESRCQGPSVILCVSFNTPDTAAHLAPGLPLAGLIARQALDLLTVPVERSALVTDVKQDGRGLSEPAAPIWTAQHLTAVGVDVFRTPL